MSESVAPTAADGDALSATESDLAWSLLSDLWFEEPDFFYEDVLAVTFYSDISMDSLIDSGLFDGTDASNSPNDADLFAGDFFEPSSFANYDENEVAGQFDELFAGSEETTAASESQNFEPADADIAVKGSAGNDSIALAKEEVASWSRRLESELIVPSSAPRLTVEAAWLTAAAQAREIVASDSAAAQRVQVEQSLRDSAVVAAVAAVRTPSETFAAPQMTKIELLFARFPSLLGSGSGRSSMLRLMRGERSPAADARPGADPAAELADSSLSYSQWASLLGVTGLSAASLWNNGVSDRGEVRSAIPFRTKSNGKRPVAC